MIFERNIVFSFRISGFSWAYKIICLPRPESRRSLIWLSGSLLIAGQVGERAIEILEFSDSLTALSGQILQSKGFSSAEREQPFFGFRNGQGTSSSESWVLYSSEMSKVYDWFESPALRNFTEGNNFFNSCIASSLKTGVSQRLCLRKLQQNLHEAQSDFLSIEESKRDLHQRIICP